MHKWPLSRCSHLVAEMMVGLAVVSVTPQTEIHFDPVTLTKALLSNSGM